MRERDREEWATDEGHGCEKGGGLSKLTGGQRSTEITEFCWRFIDLMRNAMILSFFKYGLLSKGGDTNQIKTLKKKVAEYEKRGNAELLPDIANYAMIEFMFSQHPKANYQAKDGSTGRWSKRERGMTEAPTADPTKKSRVADFR